MKIIIIEDEQLVAMDLAETILQLNKDLTIECILGSVKEATEYFTLNPQPDLIFCDIQLGDGLSFEIFKIFTFTVPVIFCTAYDEYALTAFNANAIDYILKPFNRQTIEKALLKFENFKSVMIEDISKKYNAVADALAAYRLNESSSYIVNYRNRFFPIKYSNIALFHLDNDTVRLYTTDGKTYFISENLEDLEKKLLPLFFRVNRQYVVNRNAILEAVNLFPRKLKIYLKIPFRDEITVSREKKTKVLQWLLDDFDN